MAGYQSANLYLGCRKKVVRVRFNVRVMVQCQGHGENSGILDVRSSMNFAKRWVLRSALNFASDGEVVREVGREFQRKGPEKAKADLAKECLTRVKKKREEEDDRKPGRLDGSSSAVIQSFILVEEFKKTLLSCDGQLVPYQHVARRP
ncbi:hypothetical protein HELRODRAFT_184108 [Helobdella robusta]|uniref:Uncharacterized protein n=1 Tax=Helobdella robusta TaxID=6412 RepID=T1FKL4_HELRO|nr:hypothetical protein HELRODRAFT_184108 [Helobdella robusta]ESO07844.1 hypothetical protein HELRODRAFT_184108 [Helobdella robusta]